MIFSLDKLEILVVEDNIGDFTLIEEYLKMEVESLTIDNAKSFAATKEKLSKKNRYDIVLLDLSLPDANVEELLNEIIQLADEIPVIVLTGFSVKSFGVKTLALGISDYLLKDDLNSSQLSRSISYSIERKRIHLELKASEIKNKIAEAKLLEVSRQSGEHKMMALRSVMNPHFLFNCLNSIQYFIARNERKSALDYLSIFAILIRKILDSSMHSTISLKIEIEILKLYIDLEMLRFEHKFDFVLTIDPEIDIESILIPSLLIQPYVENAILHGLNNKEVGMGHLKIHLFQDKGYLVFDVEDNGIGREKAGQIKEKNNMKEKSYGMLLTKERLEIINKTSDVSITILDLRDPQGTASGTSLKVFIKL